MKKEIKEFVRNGISVVEKLLEDKEYPEAVKACGEILEVDPKNRKAAKLLEKAQSLIKNEKQEIFKRNFPKLKKLYKESKYEEALELGKKLQQIKDSPKLTNLVNKCRQASIKTFLKKGFATHKKLKKDHKWLEAIEALKEILQVDHKNEHAKLLLKKDKIRYIDDQLHSEVKDALIKEGQYEKLYKFYQKLYLLFPEHKRLKKEIHKAEKLILKKRRADKSGFIKESITKTKQLFTEGKFEEAIQAAKEVMYFTDGENVIARTLFKKSIKANTQDTEQKLKEKFAKLLPALTEEFKTNPKGFVRI